jgi:hypothetical protein
MRKILLALALAAALLAGSAGTAGAAPAAAAKSAPLPVLYNLGGDGGIAVWNLPQVKPKTFFIFADGSGAVIDMRWARWTHTTAVTSTATDYYRTGPCCTKSDQHYVKVTVTLSGVRSSGGPRPGPYFTKMVIAGRGIHTLRYTYEVSHGFGGWLGGD